MRPLFISVIFLFVLSFANQISAQGHYRFTRHWNVSGYVGTSNYHGGVSGRANSFRNSKSYGEIFYKDRKFGTGIYLDKMFNPYIGVRGSFMFATMKGTKEKENIYFIGNMYSYSLSMVIDFSNIFMSVDKYRSYQIYGFVGFGLSKIRSELHDLLNDSLLNQVGYPNEGGGGSRLSEITIPVGLGFRYKFDDQFSVFGEITRHIIFSNKIDAYPEEGTVFESVGLLNIGVTYFFRLPNHWSMGGVPKYNGKSSDYSIRQFNKKKHVIMKTKQNKKARKMRKHYGYKKKRFRFFR